MEICHLHVGQVASIAIVLYCCDEQHNSNNTSRAALAHGTKTMIVSENCQTAPIESENGIHLLMSVHSHYAKR